MDRQEIVKQFLMAPNALAITSRDLGEANSRDDQR